MPAYFRSFHSHQNASTMKNFLSLFLVVFGLLTFTTSSLQAMKLASAATDFPTSGSIGFAIQSSSLSNDAKLQLQQMAVYMQNNTMNRVIIKGHGGGDHNLEQLAQDRMNNILDYMSSTMHIDRTRFTYSVDGNPPTDVIDYQVDNSSH